MNPFSLGLICSVLTTFPLALFVWRYRPNESVNRSFAIYSLSIGFWALFSAVQTLSPDPAVVSWAVRVMHWGAIFIPVFFLQFLYVLTRRVPRSLLVFCYIAALVFLVLNTTDLFVSGIIPKKPFHFFMKAGPAYPYYVIFFVFSWSYGVLLLFLETKRNTGQKKMQFQLLFWGSLVGYLGGSGAFAPVYDFNLPLLYPYGNFAIAAYVGVTAYTIVRHQFLDIEVIIKRTLVFAGLFGMVMAVVGGVSALTQIFISQFVAANQAIATTISIFIALFLYDPTRKLIVHVTDRFLFQKKEEFRLTMNRLAENIITMLDLDKVGQIILSTLRESLRLESGSIIIKDESDKGYYVLDAFNIKAGKVYYEIDDIFIRYFIEHRAALNLDDPAVKGKLPTLISARLGDLNAIICIPLFIHKDLIGILALGKKKSDIEFKQDEMGYFPTMASQVAIALSNARNTDILRKSQVEFIQQAKMAAIGTFSAGINHDIKNPLNDMHGAIDMHQMNWESGLFSNYSKEDYHQEVEKMTHSLLEDITKIDDIVKSLSEFAYKGGADLKLESVDLEREVDSAHRLLRSHLHHDIIDFIKEFPSHFPRVFGDAGRINEILVNIINNARQAIKHNGTIKVTAKKNHDRVTLNISDDGPGMSEEIQQKIFDPFFTTKAQGEGTGLGLHICREVIKRMNGRISVKSAIGKGTTFSIEFPISKQ